MSKVKKKTTTTKRNDNSEPLSVKTETDEAFVQGVLTEEKSLEETNEVEICDAWKKILGITLNPDHVRDHLVKLKQYERKTRGKGTGKENTPETTEEVDEEDPKALPYLDATGELRIPFNCPKKYRWWQGGQTISETLAELTKKQK